MPDCPDCGNEMVEWYRARCRHCDYVFDHQDMDAARLQLRGHLKDEHGIERGV